MGQPIESAVKNTMERRRGAPMPCKYYETDKRTGKLLLCYPLVDCNYICEKCGWNPKVKAARLRKMGFKNKRAK